jgi:hypothetical protein
MLPEAISEALGIGLSKVMALYFRGIDEGQRDRLVWDAIDRRQMNEEDERNRVREMDVERPYERDDTF